MQVKINFKVLYRVHALGLNDYDNQVAAFGIIYSGRLRKRLPKIVAVGTGSNMKSQGDLSGYKCEQLKVQS